MAKFGTFFPDRPLTKVSGRALEAALSFCRTPGTYMRYRARLGAILALAKATGWLRELPMPPTRRVAQKQRIWLTRKVGPQDGPELRPSLGGLPRGVRQQHSEEEMSLDPHRVPHQISGNNGQNWANACCDAIVRVFTDEGPMEFAFRDGHLCVYAANGKMTLNETFQEFAQRTPGSPSSGTAYRASEEEIAKARGSIRIDDGARLIRDGDTDAVWVQAWVRVEK